MKNIFTQFAMAVVTALLFVLMLVVNEWMFASLIFTQGANWIYLPAGVRLLCTLLFAEAGAAGLLIGAWLTGFFYFFPGDWWRSFSGAIVATLAPYGMYCAARRYMGLNRSLVSLTPKRLLWLGLIYALANGSAYQVWLVFRGQGMDLERFLVTIWGDFSGTLIVLYAFKAVLMLLPEPGDRHGLK
ncbi:MAG: hypothetical protein JO200_17805 [Comamonas sp.]|nr:hypothetical protein [Comamonas sp.]